MDIEGNVTSTGPYIETVRSLHQTVIALRTALEQSKKEILELKSKAWPIDTIEQSLTTLAIENHVLRRKLLDSNISLSKTAEDLPETDVKNTTPGDSEENIKALEQPLQDEHNLDVCSESEKALKVNFDSTETEKKTDCLIENSESANKDTGKEDTSLKETDVASAVTEVEPSVTNIIIKENIQPNIIEVSPTLKVHKRRSSKKKSEENKKVHFSDSTPENLTATDTKEAKKRKYSIKKQLKLHPTLGINTNRKHRIRASIHVKAKTFDDKKVSRSLDSHTVIKTPSEHVTVLKSTSFFNINSEINCEISNKNFEMTDNNNLNSKEKVGDEQEGQSGCKTVEINENDTEQEPEVDDIELIFTTDDTKESDFKEQLVSIDSIEGLQNTCSVKLLAPELEQSLDISDRELDDDVFGTSFEHENQENSFQGFQLTRDNSQLYNSKSDNSINREDKSLRSYYSYQDSSFENKSLEKDESFDRFEERIRIVETDISKVGIQEVEYAGIRRNTCPNPLQYRPILHREAITKGLNVKKSRPILAHSNAIRKESGAQTDISALPGSVWRSESSLANKTNLGENFTTLPSKFPLPGSRLKLSEKRTVEARRVLLSDIGFTSMVPELSRSADHLCPTSLKPPVTSYGQFLRTPELYSPAYTSQRFTWTTTTATPSDGSHSHSRYSIHPLSPPIQTRRCSAPVSPSRRTVLKSTPSRVRFANGSLPELRGDWTQMTADSEDSTDSLVDEAENYLRRSIDCILGSSKETDYGESRRNTFRRASAPVSISENIPPQGWQPFLPRQPRDLKPEHWVKVITPEGKVKGGRVRYIGPVATQTEQFVGVQLAVPEGHSDGTYNTRRYFQCEPYHAIFVPFKKVIMGWRP
ncbi:hypothetical protein HHI36_015477 [Cryptolaemus montrouzieri]|uniref:CAP-Gly domain-containing protein n=1 Tax=Cryptolaemus montrouzieri TaxID=559131 RepID=A0ABD2N5Z1_9CUCU